MMALQKDIIDRKLQLRLQKTEEDGGNKLTNLAFPHVFVGASDEAVYAAGKALASLQELPVVRIASMQTVVYSDTK